MYHFCMFLTGSQINNKHKHKHDFADFPVNSQPILGILSFIYRVTIAILAIVDGQTTDNAPRQKAHLTFDRMS